MCWIHLWAHPQCGRRKADWGHTKQTRASDSPVLTPECSEVQLELLVVNVCSKLYSALFQNKLYFKLKSAHYRTSSAHVLTSVMRARYWQVQCGTEFVTLSVEQCVLRNYINSIHLSFQTVQSAMPISYMFMLHLSYMYVYGQCMHLWWIPQISKPQRAFAQVLFSESDVERLRHQIRDLYISFDCF